MKQVTTTKKLTKKQLAHNAAALITSKRQCIDEATLKHYITKYIKKQWNWDVLYNAISLQILHKKPHHRKLVLDVMNYLKNNGVHND